MSFLEAYEEYLLFANRQQKKQSYNVFSYNFKANILVFFKDFFLDEISTNDILKWQEYILSKNFCNNHNKNLYSMLRSFFDFCHIKYNFDLSVLFGVFPFPDKIEVKNEDYYTLKEFNRFIYYVKDPIYNVFFKVMFFCGTRPGEAMALKFSDLIGNYIYINKTIDSHGNREIGTPKTKSSNRKIFISNSLKNDLNDLKKIYSDCTDDYFIFGGLKPLAPTTINRYKFKACKLANLRPIRLHQFRHSHATYLFHNNVDVHYIRDRLGHSKISTTLDVYTHGKNGIEKRVNKLLSFHRFNVFPYNFKSILKHFSMF